MAKKIIIFGASSFSTMIAEYIKRFTDKEIVAFTVNKEYLKNSQLINLPVIEFENIEEKFNPSDYSFINAIGYTKMNTVRENIFYNIKEKGYTIEEFIHPSANICADKIGEGNIILENVFIGPHAIIGNGNIIWNGVNISHDAQIGNFNCIAPSTAVAGNVTIKNNCFLGINSSIKNGLTISNKTLIGASCFLNKDTNEEDVYIIENSAKRLDIKSSDFCKHIK